LGRKIRQNHWLGALFATLEHRSANGLEGSLCATLGGGYLRNRAGRIDNDVNHFRARFDGGSAFFTVECVQNVLRCYGMQIGPWLALHYDWQRQNEYAETSSATVGATSLSDVDHSIASSLLGIHFEWECDRKERGASAFGKFGWHCQALRHHSDAIATVQGTPLGGFPPYQHYGARHAVSVALGIRGRFNRYWSCDGQWHGDFARGKHDNHLSAQLCHHF
ncbi:MAG: autotransporter outer membrane beta-barrel domain-containing protein, partial [Puniceicoccales bacterium]|nr:autotransporter outer membrane beta-barrel domain-containing protein [Puniceicoccales bacterium]